MLLTYDRNLIESDTMTPEMTSEEIEAALTTLTDPTTAPALAQALGYSNSTPISQACREGRILGAQKVGGLWLIPLHGVREAIQLRFLRPGWKS
jgi:hypothetical protein